MNTTACSANHAPVRSVSSAVEGAGEARVPVQIKPSVADRRSMIEKIKEGLVRIIVN